MKDIICPLDGRPCEKDCPDRYCDVPEGGCFLTTALEQGVTVLVVRDRAGRDQNSHPLPV